MDSVDTTHASGCGRIHVIRPKAAITAAGLAIAAMLCGPSRSAVSQPEPPLLLETTIPLAGVSGRIDHMALDPGRNRLFVAELGNNSVDVVDLSAGQVVRRIGGLKEPQGIGYAANADLLLVANAGDGTVRMYQGGELVPAGTIPLGSDADNVRLDPHDGTVVAGYGDGGLAVIDPGRRVALARIRLPAHPEGFQIAPDGGQALVNLPDARQIAVVDLRRRTIAAVWKPLPAAANFPMALDSEAGLLVIAFRSPAKLALLDEASGTPVAEAPLCGDADDVFADNRRNRLYVSCGSGEVAVFQRDGRALRHLSRVASAAGARTSLFSPELDRLFVARRAGWLGRGAAILVFRPTSP